MENSTTPAAAATTTGVLSCDKLDRMANWLGATVSSAFFASLDRCSCINLATADVDDDEEKESHDRPLVAADSADADKNLEKLCPV